LLPAILLCVTFLANQLTFNPEPTWSDLEQRAVTIGAINFAIGFIFMARLKTPEFILGLIFIVCSFYFQAMLIEVQNQVLYLKNLRPSFMAVITALQLATIIFILIKGSPDNGGKRAKHNLSIVNRGFRNLFHYQTYKVKS
jgi:hypothetical protein